MGLDYTYMLYFKREQLADVLLGVVYIAESLDPPTHICFPDRVLTLPLQKFPRYSEDNVYQYDDPEIAFSTALIFEEDQAIHNWGHAQQVWDPESAPPRNAGIKNLVSVGYIYLTIYNDLSMYDPEIILDLKDLVLFEFGTTGTRMSTMFLYSTSIRKKFTELLRKFNGVCGLFNDEEKGEVFWLDGKEICGYIDDVWMSPDDIAQKLLNR